MGHQKDRRKTFRDMVLSVFFEEVINTKENKSKHIGKTENIKDVRNHK